MKSMPRWAAIILFGSVSDCSASVRSSARQLSSSEGYGPIWGSFLQRQPMFPPEDWKLLMSDTTSAQASPNASSPTATRIAR